MANEPELVTVKKGTEEHFRFLVDELGFSEGYAREVVAIESGRSDGDVIIVEDAEAPKPSS